MNRLMIPAKLTDFVEMICSLSTTRRNKSQLFFLAVHLTKTLGGICLFV